MNLNQEESHSYDTIVIGSGAGGLATAICLARSGQKVLVLEQHDVPGGWCHSFYLKGHRFTPGVHYVGLLGDGEATSDLYRGLEIANDLVFFRMKPSAYEHVQIGAHRFDFPSSFEDLVQALCHRFPKEKSGIRKYLNLVKKVVEELYSRPYNKGILHALAVPYKMRHMYLYGLLSLRRVIGWYIRDPLLRNILNIQCGDHGVQPKKVPLVMHGAVMYHYFHGAYYPMGGGGALIKAMTNTLKRYGGELRTSTPVDRILVEGSDRKRAVGVALDDGTTLYARHIVSNADVGITYNRLVGKELLSKGLQKKLATTRYSSTSLMLFLTVSMDLRAAGLDSGNLWVMPERDLDSVYDDQRSSDPTKGDCFEALFISCTTLKDPASYDGKHHTIEVITLVDYTPFERFQNEGEPRSKDYLELKERLTTKMINGLEKAIPGIKEHIVHYELGTPITNEYYVNTTRGNIYGTEKSLGNIGPFAFKARSEIENLYLCGASILSHGVAGASHSGVDTAAQILGVGADELKRPREDQAIRIYEAEDDGKYPDWMRRKMQVKRARAASADKKEVV